MPDPYLKNVAHESYLRSIINLKITAELKFDTASGSKVEFEYMYGWILDDRVTPLPRPRF
jgi:hypothetical protein